MPGLRRVAASSASAPSRSGLDLYGNYTLTAVRQDNSGSAPSRIGRIVDDQRTSVHKLNAGVQGAHEAGRRRLGGLPRGERPDVGGAVGQPGRRGRERAALRARGALLNARLGYRFLGGAADVSLVGFNLVGVEHRQHPFGQLLGRRVMTMFSYRF